MQVRLRSFKSEQETALQFTNASNHHVRAIWLTFDGDEVGYAVGGPWELAKVHAACPARLVPEASLLCPNN